MVSKMIQILNRITIYMLLPVSIPVYWVSLVQTYSLF